MSRPTTFEIMRRNRTRWERREHERLNRLYGAIDEVETDVDREWAAARAREQAERAATFVDTADWLRQTREEASRREQRAARPSPLLAVLEWALFRRSGRA